MTKEISEEKQKEMQQKYMELQAAQQNMQHFHKQIQLIDQQITEITAAQKNISDIKEVKEGTEILIPVTNGVFAKANMKKDQELIVNVGAEVGVTKSSEDTIEMLSKQINDMTALKTELESQVENLGKQSVKLEKELTKLIQ